MCVILLTLALSASSQDVEKWGWQSDGVFVQRETLEKKSPQEFYQLGLKLAKLRQTDEALLVFQLILKNVSDRALIELVRFKRGETLWSGSRFLPAYRVLDDFLRLHPESKHAQRAKQLEMDSAFLLARQGYSTGILGSIPILKLLTKSEKKGVTLLLAALRRYPREPFSSGYYYKLAELYFREEKFPEAQKELKFILTEYKETVSAPMAILLLGDIGLKKFDSIDYDIRGLKDARRHFERFVEEAPAFSRLSPSIAKYVKEKTSYALEKISFINDKEAEKEYEIAEYYRGKEAIRSAKIYYKSILKRYPKTTWAEKSRKRMKEIGP